jgi:hypothetical protein
MTSTSAVKSIGAPASDFDAWFNPPAPLDILSALNARSFLQSGDAQM